MDWFDGLLKLCLIFYFVCILNTVLKFVETANITLPVIREVHDCNLIVIFQWNYYALKIIIPLFAVGIHMSSYKIKANSSLLQSKNCETYIYLI